jgi:hypothetical protein
MSLKSAIYRQGVSLRPVSDGVTVNLRAIRVTAGITPTQMAAKLGLSPNNGRITVAQIEARQDWLLSSLTAYFKAAGAEAELVVTVDGERFIFELA